MKNLISTFLLILFAFCISQGQDNQLKFSNARDFDNNRYEEIKGSPYYFKDWVKATIYGLDKTVYENVLINYNGYTQTIEASNREKWIELNIDWYLKVVVKKEGNEAAFEKLNIDQVVFKRVVHPDFINKFLISWYDGESIEMLSEWYISMSNEKVETPGKTEEFKRFNRKRKYFFFQNGKMTLVKLKKKKVLAVLGKEKELESFTKKEKLKLDAQKDFEQLLKYYETLN